MAKKTREGLKRQRYQTPEGLAVIADPQMRLAVELAAPTDERRALLLHITPEQATAIRNGQPVRRSAVVVAAASLAGH